MKRDRTRLHILRKKSDLSSKAKTGVSMHCHTEYSKEMMDFIPHYADRLPIISFLWKRETSDFVKRDGRKVDFSTAFWSPPLPALDVFTIEKQQIEEANLQPIVSLTDHDNIDAPLEVNSSLPGAKAPISMEWTVPFEYGFFHLGVHNLPPDRAVDISKTLLDFTFNKENHNDAKLTEMFAMLNEIPSVLVVLNHPLWDIEMVGKQRHEELLKDFLSRHLKWIHAFEINGFRKWSENKGVIELAEAHGAALVTGGDRHGCKPNTVINLTDASSFEEFVDEIRIQKRSEVALMPAYEQPLHSRQLESFAEILSHYPHFRDDRRQWFDRVFFDVKDGKGLQPLTSLGWKRGPRWLRMAIGVLGIMGSPAVRPAFRLARKRRDRVPKEFSRFVPASRSDDEIALEPSSDPIG